MNATEARVLSAFYKRVFGLVDRRPPTRLSGEAVSRGIGLPGSDMYAIWLCDPNERRPFLEIIEYKSPSAARVRPVNAPGYGHVCFEVSDIHATIETVLQLGGSLQGEVTQLGPEEAPHLVVYMRDPEGNIVELEQAPNINQ